jgi:SAM-dependent methyltransferase
MINSKQYNQIAESFQYAEISVKKYLKMPQIKNLISDFKNKMILDIACGNGLFAKFAFENGAKKVDCIDISERQIILAKKTCRRYLNNMRFIVGDFVKHKFHKDYKYDAIFAFYILNYLPNIRELKKALQKMKDLLSPEGIVVGLVLNPENPVRAGIHYGISHRINGSKILKNGGTIIMSYYDDENKKLGEIEYHYWDKKTYENAFHNAGFKCKWIRPVISKIFLEKFGEAYCKTMIRKPTFAFFTLRKAKPGDFDETLT